MGIVDAKRLNRFLSAPNWNDEQWDEAEDLLEETESTLADKLMTKITTVPYVEQVAILQTGLVATRYPVFSVTSVNGTPVTGELPAPWVIQDGYLRWTQTGSFPPLADPSFSLTTGWSALGMVPRVNGVGGVNLAYQAGWGNNPTLRQAILRHSGRIWLNRHDDSIMARNLDSQDAPPLPSEEWTAAELDPLGIYRNLMAFK